MQKQFVIFLLWVFISVNTLFAHNFEGTQIPSTIHTEGGKSELALSREYYKNGTQSLFMELGISQCDTDIHRHRYSMRLFLLLIRGAV